MFTLQGASKLPKSRIMSLDTQTAALALACPPLIRLNKLAFPNPVPKGTPTLHIFILSLIKHTWIIRRHSKTWRGLIRGKSTISTVGVPSGTCLGNTSRVRHSGDVWLEPHYAFIRIRFFACARPWGTVQERLIENRVLTQHEQHKLMADKCGAWWEISPPPTLSLFYCVPLVWAVHDSLQDESISPHQDREREREREGK